MDVCVERVDERSAPSIVGTGGDMSGGGRNAGRMRWSACGPGAPPARMRAPVRLAQPLRETVLRLQARSPPNYLPPRRKYDLNPNE